MIISIGQKKTISILSESDKTEMLMEINSHIYEAISTNQSNEEIDNLISVIEDLGRPEEFLVPIVAEKKIHYSKLNQSGRRIITLNLQPVGNYEQYIFTPYWFLYY